MDLQIFIRSWFGTRFEKKSKKKKNNRSNSWNVILKIAATKNVKVRHLFANTLDRKHGDNFRGNRNYYFR